MNLPENVVNLLLDRAVQVASGMVDQAQQDAVGYLYRLLSTHPTIGPLLLQAASQPDDPQARDELANEVAEESKSEPLQSQLPQALGRIETDNVDRSNLNQDIRIGDNASGTFDITAGHTVIRGDKNHIGDQIKNFYSSDPKLAWGATGGVAILVIVIIFLANSISTPADGSEKQAPATTAGTTSSAGNASSKTTASSSSTAAAIAPSGQRLYTGKTFLAAESNGQTLVIKTGATKTSIDLTAIDIKTGRATGSYGLPAFNDPQFASPEGCNYQVVRRNDGANVLLNFEEDVTAAQGTIPTTITRRLVARKAEDGTELWTAKSEPKADKNSAFTKSGSGCRGTVSPDSISADGAFAWISFAGNDRFESIDMTTGNKLSIPDADLKLLGSYAGVRVGQSDQFAGAPDHLNLVSLKDGSVAGVITDDELTSKIASGYGFAVSGDSKKMIFENVPDFVSYTLPDISKTWSQTEHKDMGRIEVDTSSNTVVGQIGGSIDVFITGSSLTTGEELWKIENANAYCGRSNGKAYLIANNQFATINLADGKQISFDASVKKCPRILDGVMITDTSSVLKL
ncbi:hypothetical protein [Umezawaea sp. Da 62-37]|uniref:hypothetical protein n=1 Tax=Umezawaea sp. Da 62-37 TaxID=3075927 RepID=UPI0028F6E382|nr:hypothetical protein [Umezawaea sp. Da 62-37]WNV83487.1 hypothetical protein RM788_35655 [Umezawaea sp. Da 62-37]